MIIPEGEGKESWQRNWNRILFSETKLVLPRILDKTEEKLNALALLRLI
jgi:hypothetical protein